MPVMFWNDSDGIKYQEAYFKQAKGVWYHGDYLIINSLTGGVQMLGRSDGTLNPAGVRFGSAEIYNISKLNSDSSASISGSQRFPRRGADSSGQQRTRCTIFDYGSRS